MRHVAFAALAAAAVAALAPVAAAQGVRQEAVFQRSFYFNERVRERLEATEYAEQPALVRWGGIYVPSYTFFNDVDNDHSQVTIQDLRLWTHINVDQVHTIYARALMTDTDWGEGDSRGFREHDLWGPNLEVGYYELDVRGAAARYCGQDLPCGLRIRGGRQYVEVGRGITLAEYLDSGSFELEAGNLWFHGFAGQTNRNGDNFDRSIPGYTRSLREFYGFEARYHLASGHVPYGYVVIQRDRSTEDPDVFGQNYDYDSEYYGVGLEGNLAARTSYVFESVWETGRGAANGQARGHEKVRGYAFDAEVNQYFEHPCEPELQVEYAYASGDPDRQNATTAAMGNRLGTVDESFLGFGYVNTGLALAARFTNIQFVRVGGKVTPVNDKVRCGRLDLGANFYFLYKARGGGPITDVLATRGSNDLGHELDLFAEWRVFSDLSVSVLYGRFFPGRAYDNRKDRDFFYTALTFSF